MENNLPEGWKYYRVDEIKAPTSTSIAIGPFGSRMKSDCYTEQGVPVIRGTNISDTKEFHNEFVYISEEKAKEMGSSNVYDSDLVFPHRGAIGEVGIVTGGEKAHYVLSSSLMKLTPDKNKVVPLFLFYYFRSPDGKHELLKNASQVGTPGIATPLTSLKSARILLPPLSTQKSIAFLLGSLDDKIELNRQMNQTLEAMARAIFQSWFVDFDPVRAKAAGQETGLPVEIAGLFPDGFEESPLGEIPKGWDICKLSKVCSSIFSGGTPSTTNPDYWGGQFPWLSSGETGERFIVETKQKITEAGIKNSSTRYARAGSTVIAGAGQGKTRGQTSLIMLDTYINQSVVVLQANPNLISDLFLFFNLSRRYEEFRQISDSHSSRGSLTTKLLGQSNIIIPTHCLIEQFDKVVQPMVEQIEQNLRQSKALAELRNILLPRLMSGEMQVAG